MPHATDPDGNALVFMIENLPSWADFDSVTGSLSGVPAHDDVGYHSAIRIGVSDGQHHVWLNRFDLAVREISRGSVLLSWEAPSQNTDGSPTRDLAGFKIYWGNDPKWHTETLAIAGTGITDYRFTGLAPGLYYFATSAVTSLGLESERSDVATILVR